MSVLSGYHLSGSRISVCGDGSSGNVDEYVKLHFSSVLHLRYLGLSPAHKIDYNVQATSSYFPRVSLRPH